MARSLRSARAVKTARLVLPLLIGASAALASRAQARPGAGVVLSSFAAPPGAARPAGVTFDGAEIWIASLEDVQSPGSANELIVVTQAGDFVRRMAGGSARPFGKLAFDGTNVRALRSGAEVHALDGTGSTLASFGVAQSAGIAYDPARARLFSLGAGASTSIDELDAAGAVVGTITTTAAHGTWSGLAFDGCTLWTSDLATDRLLRLDPATGGVVAVYRAPATNAEGLAFQHPFLILVTDTDTDRVYRVEAGSIEVGGARCTPGIGAVRVDGGVTADGGLARADGSGEPDSAADRDAGRPSDAGVTDAGAADSGRRDLGFMFDDAASTPDTSLRDAASPPWRPDAAASTHLDAGTDSTAQETDDDGCRCVARSRRAAGVPWLALVLAFSALTHRRPRNRRQTP